MADPRVRTAEMFERARSLHARGDAQGAVRLYREVLKHQPQNPTLLRLLGGAELACGLVNDGMGRLSKAAKLDPRDPAPLAELGMAAFQTGRVAEAISCFEQALQRRSGHAPSIYGRTVALCAEGRHGEALRALEPIVRSGSVDPLVGAAFGRVCRRTGHHTEGAAVLMPLASQDNARADLLFELAALLHGAKRYDEAFEAAERAHARLAVRHDPALVEAATADMLATWTHDRTGGLPRSAISSDAPVFVIGMPRAGGALVEAILAAHPRVRPLGETGAIEGIVGRVLGTSGTRASSLAERLDGIKQPTMDRAAATWLQAFGRSAGDATRWVDRTPANFAHLGLLKAMFPSARFVHVVRNPLDACLSSYFHPFRTRPAFASNLAHLGGFQRAHDRLMDHWRAVLGEGAWHEVRYEAMVEDPEGQVRSLVEAIGLPWNDACGRFWESDRRTSASLWEEIRVPIHARRVGWSAPYGARLGPLREAMGGPAVDGERS